MGRILYKQTVVQPEPLTPGLPPAMRSVPLVFPAGKPVPVWRADQIDRAVGGVAARSSGNTALDAELPGGGWPAGWLIELLLPAPGCGELRLLAPARAAASLLWIAPSFTPYAPALAGLGLMIERLTIVTPANAADAAWAAEQALRSGALSAVLWWQGETHTAAFPPPCAACTWQPRRAARPCSRCGRTSCARNPRPHRCAWRSSRLLRRAWPSRCSSAVGRRWRRRSCCAARAGLCNRSRESPAMLWFALHLSELPLEAWRVATPARDALARPCCVVEGAARGAGRCGGGRGRSHTGPECSHGSIAAVGRGGLAGPGARSGARGRPGRTPGACPGALHARARAAAGWRSA